MIFRTKTPDETVEAGRKIGQSLKPGDAVCLYGELGAGKTTLTKGIAEALGISQREIASASFTIIAEHEGRLPLHHIDLYRIRGEADLEPTGIYDCLGGKGVSVIEWAERLPAKECGIEVRINITGPDEREISVEGLKDC